MLRGAFAMPIHNRIETITQGTTTHHHGEDDHHAFLEGPFNQAIAAIHQKMHEHGIPH
jgi:hypothetical protein